jgi:C-terminal processing protease CtpA/Prc
MSKFTFHFFACSLIALMVLLATLGQDAFGQPSLSRSANVRPHPMNLDFEQATAGQVPDGWDSPTRINYAVELTDVQPKSGKRAALLRSIPMATPGDRNPFGNLMQAIDATPFRGKRVRLRGAVRTESTEMARAQLWLRVDRTDNQIGFFDNMSERPITSSDWKYYEIIGDVDDDAAVINIGMLLLGTGKAWLDDVTFEDLGTLVIRAEPARPLTDRGLENLVAFTRLLGYVRHFHPSDEASATNWDIFAIEGIGVVERARNATELAQKLEDVFRPVAPFVRVFQDGKRPPVPKELATLTNDQSLKTVSWQHKGFGQKSGQGGIYMSERMRNELRPGSSKQLSEPFLANLGGGVSSLIPLTLQADDKGTLPHAASKTAESKPSLVKYSGNDRATRLANVALAWNIFQHFYPYFDVVTTDWPRVLRTSLTSAATDPDERAFLITLRRMVAQLQDGHGGVYHPSASTAYTVPLILGAIEGQLVVTEVAAAGADGLQPGDIVLKVNGESSDKVLVEKESLISGATPQWRHYTALTQIRAGAKDSEMRLEVSTQNGQTRSVTLRRTIELQALRETRPPKVHELKPGIFYLDLDRIKDEDFAAALPQLEKAKGIIFDLRGYPSVSPKVITHLIDKPVESARWMVPVITTPDQTRTVEYDTRGRWTLEPAAPRLRGKIAFLTDGRAISYAESYMGIIEAYKLAEIVGETTAGTNGNINPFVLTGNYRVVWTGMKVLKHDGSRHHGVGIRPTVQVSRTIRGVREKRDEQLERAIEVVSQ